jgi:hypothetical protein
LERSGKLPSDLLRVTSFWYVNFTRQPVPGERKTRYAMRLVQSENYGISFGRAPASRAPSPSLVGEDARKILSDRLYADNVDRAAFVDLIMGHLVRSPDRTLTLEFTLREKYAARARLFASEVERILRRKGALHLKGPKPRVLVIGATAGIIGALRQRKFKVFATDLASDVVGERLGGVKVHDGKVANARFMKEAVVASVTGMTLADGTLSNLMALAKRHNTSTLIWAITGRNLGEYFTQHGADCAISDPSPFLRLPGPAKLALWRRKR